MHHAALAALAARSARPAAPAAARSSRNIPRGGPKSAARLGEILNDKPIILVLFTGNSARSQIAEAFLRKYKSHRFTVASAGTHPKPQIHSLAVQVMAEIGIDITAQRPKDMQAFTDNPAVKHVLIVCDNANQSCPRIWPGAFSRTFMPFDDPAAETSTQVQQLQIFRRVRDEIDLAIQNWNPEQRQEIR